MAFKQGNNPLSRKASPMRMSPFKKQESSMSMDDLNKLSAKQDAESLASSRAGNVGAPGDPGTEINYNDPKKFAGDDEGMLRNDFEPQFAGDDGYEDQDGMSRKEYGKARKNKKANKTSQQIVDIQKKRSSVKNVYLGDPDDLEGEMVRTADKPAGKREVRKVKKLKKTKEQLGVSRIASPLNAGPDDMEGIDSGEEAKSEEKKPGNSRAEIKARKSKQKSEGVSGSKRRANKAKSKSEAAAEKAKTAKNPDYKKQLEAKSERLAKRSKRKEGRAKIKERNKETRKANKETRKS